MNCTHIVLMFDGVCICWHMLTVHVTTQKKKRVAKELQSAKFGFSILFSQLKGQDIYHINDPWKHAPSMCKGVQIQNSNSTTRLETYKSQILIFGVKAKTCWQRRHGHQHSMDFLFLPFLHTLSVAQGRFVMVCAYPHTGTPVKQPQFDMASMAKLMKANTWRHAITAITTIEHRVLDRSWNQNLVNLITFQSPKWYLCETLIIYNLRLINL